MDLLQGNQLSLEDGHGILGVSSLSDGSVKHFLSLVAGSLSLLDSVVSYLHNSDLLSLSLCDITGSLGNGSLCSSVPAFSNLEESALLVQNLQA